MYSKRTDKSNNYLGNCYDRDSSDRNAQRSNSHRVNISIQKTLKCTAFGGFSISHVCGVHAGAGIAGVCGAYIGICGANTCATNAGLCIVNACGGEASLCGVDACLKNAGRCLLRGSL